MELYLVRHAVAAERSSAQWPDDAERPLTPDGETRFRSAARGLARVVPTVDRVLSSPYTRAWRTAELLAEETHWPGPEPCPALEADRALSEVLTVLDGLVTIRSVAMVGHEPQLSRLASRLLAGNENLVGLEVKKGGAVLLELNAVGAAAVLRWSLSPKVLRRLDPRRSG